MSNNLKSWREIMEPHEDVAQGVYRQAEFALNLAEIVRNQGRAEYTDPREFFARTYLTDGLKTLLAETLKRLTNGDGEPVIQLKTSFGGGKSHSLLALYHLFGGISAEQSETVRAVLEAAGVEFLPKVHTAVIVGTWENPLKTTLWGEIAAQLAKSAGKPELYEMMRANDESGISPGAELLKKLFDEVGACLILIDELVAYGRKLNLGEIENGGSFGNLMSFIQELTEAAKASQKTVVVVSIPESDAEIVDNRGRQVLEQVEKVFGRMEFVWTPVTVYEGYEIVRRRLFKQCNDMQAKEKVCAAFFDMYVNNRNDFPYESYQSNYREKLLTCYPIHPKLFDYLYDKWTSLDGFQKTRGVLRLMAKIIYCLWKSNDESLLIMPANIPLDSAMVRDELVKLLGGNWNTIVDSDVDGGHSKPNRLDAEKIRFGRFGATRKTARTIGAARKAARTIFIGTAPGSRRGELQGIEENEIHLSVIQPQDLDKIATLNDALAKLKTDLYYLYSQNTRYWFSENPTLRKFVDDKRRQFSEDDVEFEIEKRLSSWNRRGNFKGVHNCPKNSNDVPDRQEARLVILSPKYSCDDSQDNSAINFAKEILNNRGTTPRQYKNMLLFMAADIENLKVLKDTVRDFLAWQAVLDETHHLNLDTLQIEDAKNNLKLAQENFKMKTSQAYSKIFVPKKSEDGNLNVPLQIDKITCTTEDNISAASDNFTYNDKLNVSLGSGKLKDLLDKFIWRENDFVSLNRLWEYFTTYYYMPRLIDENVLLETVKKGVAAKVFALAENYQDGNFTDLKFGDNFFGKVSTENFLVKANLAENKNTLPDIETPIETESENKNTEPEVEPLPKYVSIDIELDKLRLSKNFNDCFNEVISHLINLPNAETKIKLSVTASVSEGIPTETKEIVEANCSSLKIKNIYFE